MRHQDFTARSDAGRCFWRRCPLRRRLGWSYQKARDSHRRGL